MQPGQSVQRPFDLLNLGAAGADWTLRVGGDPAVLSPIALAQTTSPTPADDVSFACVNPADGFVLENRYFRVFALAERGTPDQDVIVSGISFGVESAQSSAGIQPITVRLYSLQGELALEHLTLLGERRPASRTWNCSASACAFDQPLTIAGDTVLVAEIYVPDGSDDGNSFYPGANSDGESAPAYWVADDCACGRTAGASRISVSTGCI